MTDPLTPTPVPTSVGPVPVLPPVITTQEPAPSATTLTPDSARIPTPTVPKASWSASAEAKASADLTRIEGLAKRALSHLTGTYAISLTALLVSVFVLFKSCR